MERFPRRLGGLSVTSALPPLQHIPQPPYLFGTLSQLNHVRMRREGADEFEQLSVAQNEFFQRTYGKTPQAGLYVLDFTEHDLMGQMLNTSQIIGPNGQPKPIQNLDFRINVNVAGTWNIYTESITTNDRP